MELKGLQLHWHHKRRFQLLNHLIFVNCVLIVLGEEKTVVRCHVATCKFMFGCAVRSFSSCGSRCPFFQASLQSFAESPSFQAAIRQHGLQLDVQAAPTNEGKNSLVLPSNFPCAPPDVIPLCCNRVGTWPQFELTQDRRMEWPPVSREGSGVWDGQCLCLTCSRTLPHSEVPRRERVACVGLFAGLIIGHGHDCFRILVVVHILPSPRCAARHFSPLLLLQVQAGSFRVHSRGWEHSMDGVKCPSRQPALGLSHGSFVR